MARHADVVALHDHANVIALLEPVRRLGTAMATAECSSTHQVSKMLELAHPRIEVRSAPGIVPRRGYVGHGEPRRYFSPAAEHEARAVAVIHRAEVTEGGNVLAAGELVSMTRQAGGASSPWFVYRFREGLISAIETYLGAETARAQAIGIR